ncbi:MAG: DUF2065 domain-containing protein [Deltaproteobacteria bacterium]|nr:DUF2065 domain-containing protein [Deltaproteobacteria bacterium]
MKYFLCVIGMVLVIEGIPYFAFPEKAKSYLLKLQELSDGVLRTLGLSAILIGLVLVYFGRS